MRELCRLPQHLQRPLTFSLAQLRRHLSDSGQGDILLAKDMNTQAPESVKLTLIHEITREDHVTKFLDPEVRAALPDQGVHVVDSYLTGALRAMEKGLLSPSQVGEISLAALDELGMISVTRFKRKQGLANRLAEWTADIAEVKAALAGSECDPAVVERIVLPPTWAAAAAKHASGELDSVLVEEDLHPARDETAAAVEAEAEAAIARGCDASASEVLAVHYGITAEDRHSFDSDEVRAVSPPPAEAEDGVAAAAVVNTESAAAVEVDAGGVAASARAAGGGVAESPATPAKSDGLGGDGTAVAALLTPGLLKEVQGVMTPGTTAMAAAHLEAAAAAANAGAGAGAGAGDEAPAAEEESAAAAAAAEDSPAADEPAAAAAAAGDAAPSEAAASEIESAPSLPSPST